jgi:hypothetical protein
MGSNNLYCVGFFSNFVLWFDFDDC